MSIRERIFGAGLTRLDLDAKGFAYSSQGGYAGGVSYGDSFGGWVSGLARPSSREYAQVRLELSSALAVCLSTVTRAFPEAELCVEREVDGESERQEQHPALMLMERPNPYHSPTQMSCALVRDYMVHGNAYLVKRRGRGNLPVELWAVDARCMRPIWPATGDVFISQYELTIDGQRRYFEPEDVLHFRNGLDHDAPSYDRCGLSPIPPMLRDLYVDDAAADFTAAMLKNMGMPGAIISPKSLVDGRAVTWPQPEREAFVADYQKRFTGQGRGRVMPMGVPIDVQQLGFDPKNMALGEVRRLSEERLCATYNIPAQVAGFSQLEKQPTYSNYEQAYKAFWTGCIIPMQREMAWTLTEQLLRADWPNTRDMYFEYEHDHIPALTEDETARRDRDRADYLAGGLDHHQYVGRLGIEPTGPNFRVLPASVIVVSVDEMPMTETPAVEPAPEQLALPPAPKSARTYYRADPGATLDVEAMLATSDYSTLAPGTVLPTGAIYMGILGADDPPDIGTALNWTDDQIEAEAIVTDEDIADATEWVRENVPALADLLDAETIKRKETKTSLRPTPETGPVTLPPDPRDTKATYRWNPRARRYIGTDGRLVSKTAVDAAMDAAVEVGRAEMAGYADALIEGTMDLPAYQIAMKQSIKRMHLTAAATTRGGWANLTPSERGKAAQRIQEQYRYLNQSCLDFESGARPVDGRMRSSSKMYASSARTAYGELDYDAAKDAAEADVSTHQERWVRHASDSCGGCVHQESRAWVDLGELPEIGSQQCLSNCKCSKVVRKRPKKGKSE